MASLIAQTRLKMMYCPHGRGHEFDKDKEKLEKDKEKLEKDKVKAVHRGGHSAAIFSVTCWIA